MIRPSHTWKCNIGESAKLSNKADEIFWVDVRALPQLRSISGIAESDPISLVSSERALLQQKNETKIPGYLVDSSLAVVCSQCEAKKLEHSGGFEQS